MGGQSENGGWTEEHISSLVFLGTFGTPPILPQFDVGNPIVNGQIIGVENPIAVGLSTTVGNPIVHCVSTELVTRRVSDLVQRPDNGSEMCLTR